MNSRLCKFKNMCSFFVVYFAKHVIQRENTDSEENLDRSVNDRASLSISNYQAIARNII